MKLQRSLILSAVAGAVVLAMALPAMAQAKTQPDAITAPDYGSGVSAGALSDGNFNTPESDGRPGAKFFAYGVQAFRDGDYRHAIDMYEIAAAWAYKPAEYNLGVMYFKGQGVPEERARGAAWMVLAAERGDPRYVKARDLMVTLLSKAEFVRTDAIWNQLKPKYGDNVALRRAKAQWAWARTHQTGTRVGGAVGELRVGAPNGFEKDPAPPAAAMASAKHGWMNLLSGGSTDGSLSYRQFQQSDDPYSPVFLRHRTGNVFIEPLQPVKPADDKAKKRQPGAAAADPQSPQRSNPDPSLQAGADALAPFQPVRRARPGSEQTGTHQAGPGGNQEGDVLSQVQGEPATSKPM